MGMGDGEGDISFSLKTFLVLYESCYPVLRKRNWTGIDLKIGSLGILCRRLYAYSVYVTKTF